MATPPIVPAARHLKAPLYALACTALAYALVLTFLYPPRLSSTLPPTTTRTAIVAINRTSRQDRAFLRGVRYAAAGASPTQLLILDIPDAPSVAQHVETQLCRIPPAALSRIPSKISALSDYSAIVIGPNTTSQTYALADGVNLVDAGACPWDLKGRRLRIAALLGPVTAAKSDKLPIAKASNAAHPPISFAFTAPDNSKLATRMVRAIPASATSLAVLDLSLLGSNRRYVEDLRSSLLSALAKRDRARDHLQPTSIGQLQGFLTSLAATDAVLVLNDSSEADRLARVIIHTLNTASKPPAIIASDSWDSEPMSITTQAYRGKITVVGMRHFNGIARRLKRRPIIARHVQANRYTDSAFDLVRFSYGYDLWKTYEAASDSTESFTDLLGRRRDVLFGLRPIWSKENLSSHAAN